MGEGEYAAALSKFDKAIKANPTSAEAYLAKADAGVLVPKVTQEEVIALYNKAIELEPDNPFIYQAKGAFCMDVGLFNDAEAAYSRRPRRTPRTCPTTIPSSVWNISARHRWSSSSTWTETMEIITKRRSSTC